MNETLLVIAQLSVLVFVFISMLAVGLSLTIAQIVAPLRNTRLKLIPFSCCINYFTQGDKKWQRYLLKL